MPDRSLANFLQRHWNDSQKGRFLVVGAINTAMGFLIFACLFFLFGTLHNYLLVGVAAHCIAVCIAFYLHRHFVFRSTARWVPEFIRYNVSLLGIMLAGLAALYVLVSLLRFHPVLAQAAITTISVAASYLAHRSFSFRRHHP